MYFHFWRLATHHTSLAVCRRNSFHIKYFCFGKNIAEKNQHHHVMFTEDQTFYGRGDVKCVCNFRIYEMLSREFTAILEHFNDYIIWLIVRASRYLCRLLEQLKTIKLASTLRRFWKVVRAKQAWNVCANYAFAWLVIAPKEHKHVSVNLSHVIARTFVKHASKIVHFLLWTLQL